MLCGVYSTEKSDNDVRRFRHLKNCLIGCQSESFIFDVAIQTTEAPAELQEGRRTAVREN